MERKSAQVEARVTREKSQKVEVDQRLAMLVEEYNSLVDQHRYPEAEAVAKKAGELAPDNLVVRQLLAHGLTAAELADQHTAGRGGAATGDGGGGAAHRQPILWIREATKDTIKPFGVRGTAPRRMAFTTLGHPEDFSHAEVRRLVEQMIVWASGDERAIPAEGLKAEPGRAYEPPATR
jgi:hypothetical protein